MLELSTVMINSADPAALAGFYRKVLGEPGWTGGDYTGWKAGGGALMIGPHSEVTGRNPQPGRIMVNFETPDVPGEFARLRDLGAGVVQEPYHPGEAPGDVWLATLEDPDGNLFQLASPMPSM